MFTMIPEDLSKLSAAELRALAKEIKAKAKEYTSGEELGDEQLDEVEAAIKTANEALALAAKKERQAALSAEVEVEDDEDEKADLADDDEDEDEVEEDDEDDEAEVATTSSAATLTTRRSVRTATSLATTATREVETRPSERILASDGLRTAAAGEAFDDWGHVASALIERAESLRSNSDAKHEVAYVKADYPEHMRMDANPLFNLHLFEQEELTAALCTSPDSIYAMHCWNETRRPVFAGLPRFQGADRGSVEVYPSPSMHDINSGYGQWTFDDDDDPEAEKECAEIECGTPTAYQWYALYRCLNIKHSMLMTFPELVEAYLNRLQAVQAGFGERLLLEAMATAATSLNVASLGFNGSTSIVRTILNYLLRYQELERWDAPGMDAWLPRWALYAIKADQVSRRNTSGTVLRVPSDAEINAMFQDVGVTPHWYIDTPSWAPGIGNMAVSGNLQTFPKNLDILVYPKGKFAVMDKGRLSIGVTGNNMYRDVENLRKNQITFFVESYEGLVNLTNCPAHILQFTNLCWTGVQIADKVIGCEGGDFPGVASG